MARKKKKDEGSSGAYWMDTYGDMITLVLTFFVLLYSFSLLDETKFEAFVASYTGNPIAIVKPVNPGHGIEPDPQDVADPAASAASEAEAEAAAEAQKKEEEYKQQFDDLYTRIQGLITSNNLEGQVAAIKDGDMITLRFFDSLLFASGKADLLARSTEILESAMQIIQETQNAIKELRVEGHTDDVPINTAQFQDNWDLSAKRATNVLRFILGHTTLMPEKFTAAGYGEFHPIDDNTSAVGRERNRRVDIVIKRYVVKVPTVIAEGGASTQESDSARTQNLWNQALGKK